MNKDIVERLKKNESAWAAWDAAKEQTDKGDIATVAYMSGFYDGKKQAAKDIIKKIENKSKKMREQFSTVEAVMLSCMARDIKANYNIKED